MKSFMICTPHHTFSGDQITDEMARPVTHMGEKRNAHSIVVWNSG
jgi:hypothetical protein